MYCTPLEGVLYCRKSYSTAQVLLAAAINLTNRFQVEKERKKENLLKRQMKAMAFRLKSLIKSVLIRPPLRPTAAAAVLVCLSVYLESPLLLFDFFFILFCLFFFFQYF